MRWYSACLGCIRARTDMKMRNPTNYQRKQCMGEGKGGPGNGRMKQNEYLARKLGNVVMCQVLITLITCHYDRRWKKWGRTWRWFPSQLIFVTAHSSAWQYLMSAYKCGFQVLIPTLVPLNRPSCLSLTFNTQLRKQQRTSYLMNVSILNCQS